MNDFRASETISLDVDGAAVTCHLDGIAQEDENPVVLLHGIGGSTAADFSFVFPMLARHHRVMAVDFSQPALSEGETLQLGHLARQVCAAIDGLLPGRRVTLVGYSLGAIVAAAVAASHPAPERLVLASGWLKATTSHRMFNALWQQVACRGPAALSRFTRFSALSTSFINSCPPEELHEISLFNPGLFTAAQLDLATTADLTEVAPSICVPTLVIGCSHDAIAGREQSGAIVGAIPDARYVEVESGHAVAFERPAELLSLIEGFLRNEKYSSGSVRLAAGT